MFFNMFLKCVFAFTDKDIFCGYFESSVLRNHYQKFRDAENGCYELLIAIRPSFLKTLF